MRSISVPQVPAKLAVQAQARSNRLFDTDVKGGPRLRRSVPFAAGQLRR
jgi:hypothetical protein